MISSARTEPFGRQSMAARVVSVGVPVLVAAAAAAYGGVDPASELALLVAAGGLLAIAVAAAARFKADAGVRAATALVVAFGLLAVLQSVPLPLGLVGALSPTRAEAVSSWLDEPPAWTTLSYNAEATGHAARMVLLGGAVLVAVAMSVRSLGTAKTLLLGLFVVGVAEALLSIAQQATNAKGVYWGDVSLGGVRSGSMINHSNFSQLLNLTIGASIGLLFVRISEDRRVPARSHGYTDSVSSVFRRHGWLLIGVAVQGLAIAASLSRAGLGAMLIAATVVFVMLVARGEMKRSAWMLAVVPLVVFAGLMFIDFDRFFGRVETLQENDSYADRVELGLATFRAGLDHPVLGAGMGSHAYVFPAYDTTGARAVAETADNDYAQLFEETGLLGCLIVGAFVAVVAYAVWRASRPSNGPLLYAAYGVAYGLIAVAFQSATDFGQRVPAVFCANAALCGLALAIADEGRSAVPQSVRRDPRRLRTLFLAAAAVVVWVTAVAGAARDYRADRWWSLAYSLEQRVRRPQVEPDPLDFLDMIAAAEEAAKLHPHKVEYAFWLNAYRWQAMQLAAGGGDPTATPEGRETALLVADELRDVRKLCPSFGPAHTLEGQIRVAAGDASGERLIENGVTLVPNDPLACFAAGALTLSKPADPEADQRAYELLRRAVLLDGNLFHDAAEAVLYARNDVGVAVSLAADEPNRLRNLARLIETGGDGEEAQRLLEEANASQMRRVESGVATPREIADLARREAKAGNDELAATLYRQALASRFNEVDWRIRLVDSLTRLDRIDEAYREVRICLRLKPNSEDAQRRLEELEKLLPNADETPAR